MQGWTAGPQGCGSFDILWTCVSTLALCIWTAVHPDILRNQSFRHSLISRLGMMLIAVIFPEIIISAASRSPQWLCAKVNALQHDPSVKSKPQSIEDYSHAQVNYKESQHTILSTFQFDRISEEAPLSPQVVSRTITSGDEEYQQAHMGKLNKGAKTSIHWGSEQAFFAVMAGFAIEKDYVNNGYTNVTLRRFVTVDGVLQLAKLGLVPHIHPEQIEDRSKADVIAKLFVLSQIT
jgi:hypothetical protein